MDLQDHLEKLDTHLIIGSDSAAQLLSKLIKKFDISDVYAKEEYASEELNLIKRIQNI